MNYFKRSLGFTEVIIGIYRVYNRVSGKSYIGQGSGKEGIYGRWRDHIKYLLRGRYKCAKLQAAWNTYEHSDWVFGILEVCEPIPELLNSREKFWMDFYNVIECGYNISPTPNTTLGVKMSLEQRARMSLAQKRRFMRPEELEKYKGIRKGYHHSAETKAKIRAGNLGKKRVLIKPRPPMSEEQKIKLSIARKGLRQSEEAKHKKSLAMKKLDLIWITDGVVEDRIPSAQEIPAGWRRGRIFHSRRKRSSS